MIILAFDTCLDKMYAVLKRDDDILSSKIIENNNGKYHSAFLISTLQEIMSANNIKPQDIDLIATNIGPGSFTGIRACVTVARVMAQQLNCKTAGVSSLEILAETAVKNPLVALDARKNCAYLYCDGETGEPLGPFIALSFVPSMTEKSNIAQSSVANWSAAAVTFGNNVLVDGRKSTVVAPETP